MATTTTPGDPVTVHILDRANEYSTALTKAIEMEAATVGLDQISPELYRTYRRLSLYCVEDALKAAATLKDALDMTDDEWVEAWRKAGQNRLKTIGVLAELGADYLPPRVKATAATPLSEVKASVDQLFHSGLRVIRAIIEETK